MEFNFVAAIIWTVVIGIIVTIELILWLWREQQITYPTVSKRFLNMVGCWQDRINAVLAIVLLVSILLEDLGL